ncbi:unnamed protein product [Pleuronectes platessa]|uniref:Uncharacterized protein n=1 Tax=Pleuronectes platessa TaxID=8262 RepID=A0A9N7Z4D9_PLEPL|nr:unnamed protein product [Pleuronectes platessa]
MQRGGCSGQQDCSCPSRSASTRAVASGPAQCSKPNSLEIMTDCAPLSSALCEHRERVSCHVPGPERGKWARVMSVLTLSLRSHLAPASHNLASHLSSSDTM